MLVASVAALPCGKLRALALADLAPRHRVLGGAQPHVFGADPLKHRTEGTVATKKTRTNDLAPKSSKPVKGGRLVANDNLTLVRAAKPAKKDLPSGKDVKGGLKRL